MYACLPYMCVPPLQILVTTDFEKFECHRHIFLHTRIGVREPIRVENHWSTDWCVSLLIEAFSLVTWHWNCPTDHFCLFQTTTPMESGRIAILMLLSIVWGGQLWRLTVGQAAWPVPDDSSRLAVGWENSSGRPPPRWFESGNVCRPNRQKGWESAIEATHSRFG